MKYFTKEWCHSELSEEQIQHVYDSYHEYVEEVFNSLPFTLKILSKFVPLHDGLLTKVEYDNNLKKLCIMGIFGDLKTGYFILNIQYFKVAIFNFDECYSNLQDKKLEVLSDEIEVLNKNEFQHRILFDDNREISINFSELKISVEDTSSENYKKVPCKFVNKK